MRNRRMLFSLATLLILALLVSGCVITEDGTIVFTTPPAVPAVQQTAEETPPAEPTEEPIPATLEATVNTRSLRVRQGPSVETPIVAGLREGDAVTVVGRNEDGTWLQIRVPEVDTLGWVSAEFVTVEGDLSTLLVTDEEVPVEDAEEVAEEGEVTEEPAAEETPEEAAEEAAEEGAAEEATGEEEATEEAVAPQIDLVETARAIDEFSTLVAAIDAAALTDVLQSDGPFTVFAPTNDAFAALPEGTLEALLDDPAGDLTQILLYHVVPGRVLAADITDGLQAESFQGESLAFSVADSTATVNGANIILTDIEASNGVIHVVDSVLVPGTVDLSAPAAAEETAEETPAEETAEEPAAEEATAEEATPEEVATDEEATAEETTATEETAAEETTDEAGEEAATEEDVAPVTLAATNRLAQIDTRSLRVRTEPTTEAEVVWGVRQGEFYAVVDQTEDGAWLALAVPELEGIGWVSAEYVILHEDVTVIPTLGAATVATTDGDRLRVRNAPTTDAELRDYLFEGETYEVVAVTEDGAWALLNLANENNVPIPGPSWVATEFIEIQ